MKDNILRYMDGQFGCNWVLFVLLAGTSKQVRIGTERHNYIGQTIDAKAKLA